MINNDGRSLSVTVPGAGVSSVGRQWRVMAVNGQLVNAGSTPAACHSLEAQDKP